jgi:hypothetical protein
LKSVEAPGRSRNVSGPHLLWKRGNPSLSAVGSSFAASEEVQLIHLRFSPALVVDILTNPDAPPALVSHRLPSLSLSHTWTRGKIVIPAGSSFRRVMQRFRSVTTPRCVELNLLRRTAVSLTTFPESCMLWTSSYSWYTWHCFRTTPFTLQNVRLSPRA